MIKKEKYLTCRCGNRFSTDLESIILENGAEGKVAEYISEIFPCGHILLVISKGYDCSKIKKSLKKSDYLISEFYFSDNLDIDNLILEDSIRLIIGVGDLALSRVVKLYSHINKIPNVFIATELDDELVQDYVNIDKDSLKQYKCDLPKIIIYDTSSKLSKEQIAHNISRLYYRLIALFDYLYAYKVLSNTDCDCLIKDTIGLISDFLGKEFDSNNFEDITRLNNTLAMVIYNLSYIPNKFNSFVETMVRLLSLKFDNKLIKLVAAYAVDAVYRFWLINNISDISIPPNRVYYYEKLGELFNIDKYNSLSKIMIENNYSLIDYIIRSSNEDLMSILFDAVPSPENLMINIKNYCNDRGYHLSELISYRQLMEYLALAGELSSEFALVKHIDKSGLLWHYVDKL